MSLCGLVGGRLYNYNLVMAVRIAVYRLSSVCSVCSLLYARIALCVCEIVGERL